MLAGVPAMTVPDWVFYLLVSPGIVAYVLAGTIILLLGCWFLYIHLVVLLGWILSRRGTNRRRRSTSRPRA